MFCVLCVWEGNDLVKRHVIENPNNMCGWPTNLGTNGAATVVRMPVLTCGTLSFSLYKSLSPSAFLCFFFGPPI